MNLWEGAVRSGKTIASLIRWVLYVAKTTVSGELVVVSRTRASAARNVFAPLQNRALFGSWADHVSYTPGADTGTILGRKVWVLGSADIRSEHTLRGLTCAGAYVDEVTLLQNDFFVQLLNRLWEGARLFGTTNPDNPAHWLKTGYLDRLDELPDWRVWKFRLDDNPALSEDRKAAIRRENVGLYYRRNVLGEWVAADGAVYPMWDPARHVTPWEELPPIRRLLAVGVDYGTTNPTAAVLLGLSDTRDGYGHHTGTQLHIVDEWGVPKGHNLTDQELSTQFRAWLKAPHLPYETHLQPERVILDPSAASFRVQLQADGVAGVIPADNDVAYGTRTVASLLSTGELTVTDRCLNLIREIPGYAYDQKKADSGVDAVVKTADHWLDATRYAVTTTESIWRT